MSNDINLLSPKDERSLIEKKRLKIFRNISFVFAGLVVLFAIIIFIVNAAFSTSGIRAKQTSAVNQLAAMGDKSAKLFVVNNRISNITKLIKERNNYFSVNALLTLIPSEAKINNLNFDQEKFSVTLISSSLLPLDNVINKFIEKTAKKEIIKSLIINSLSINQKNGNYYLSLQASFL